MRRAVAADAPALAALVADGLETYRAFAPAGWDPATVAAEVGDFDTRLAPDTSYRAWVVEDDAGIAGVAGYLPAAASGRGAVAEPDLAHLRHLFVARRAWGTSASRDLLACAVTDATARGFTAFRLFCAEGQARARRFYEREGWSPGTTIAETPLGLAVVEYRRALGGPQGAAHAGPRG